MNKMYVSQVCYVYVRLVNDCNMCTVELLITVPQKKLSQKSGFAIINQVKNAGCVVVIFYRI